MPGQGLSSIIELLSGLGLSIAGAPQMGVPMMAGSAGGLLTPPQGGAPPMNPSAPAGRPPVSPMALPSITGGMPPSGPSPLGTVGTPSIGTPGGAAGSPSMASLIQMLMKQRGG